MHGKAEIKRPNRMEYNIYMVVQDDLTVKWRAYAAIHHLGLYAKYHEAIERCEFFNEYLGCAPLDVFLDTGNGTHFQTKAD